MNRFIDLTGQKFGRLLADKYIDKDKNGISMWQCKCDCGNIKIVRGLSLKNGDTKSCGCLQKERSILKNTRHGYSHLQIYYIWNNMVQRCTNINHKQYKDYGGRRIKVCKRWMKFENFYKDVGNPPDGLTLDRVDNNGNYCLKNHRWATPKEQANNRRTSLDKKSLAIRKYERKLRGCLNYLIQNGKDKISFSKYFQYNSKQLYEHLSNIVKAQNNCCPMCNKSYNEIKYDIDHTIPTSIAKTKEKLLKLFSLENLSLLCFSCNRFVKRNKILQKGENK